MPRNASDKSSSAYWRARREAGGATHNQRIYPRDIRIDEAACASKNLMNEWPFVNATKAYGVDLLPPLHVR